MASSLALVFAGCGTEGTGGPVGRSRSGLAVPAGVRQLDNLPKLGNPITSRRHSTHLNPHDNAVKSVQHFTDSFKYDGVTYSYTMVGKPPGGANTTTIDTAVYPLSFVFPAGFDLGGGFTLPFDVTVDAGPTVQPTLDSPVFQDAVYTSGTTQFGDAVQRATFWNRMGLLHKWHLRLGAPEVRDTTTVVVPNGAGFLAYFPPTGNFLAILDFDWFASQALAQIQAVDPVSSFPMVESFNTFLYLNGDPNQCCVLGFHDAGPIGGHARAAEVQTFAWASFSDLGLFGDAQGNVAPIADVHALSHEVMEWMNDPFTDNLTPPWFAPGYGCDDALEVGDPLVGFSRPIAMNGMVYHPQTEALLPWFAREVPSSALGGAYSYPDTTALVGPSTGCP